MIRLFAGLIKIMHRKFITQLNLDDVAVNFLFLLLVSVCRLFIECIA
jgi:hypothetical protein